MDYKNKYLKYKKKYLELKYNSIGSSNEKLIDEIVNRKIDYSKIKAGEDRIPYKCNAISESLDSIFEETKKDTPNMNIIYSHFQFINNKLNKNLSPNEKGIDYCKSVPKIDTTMKTNLKNPESRIFMGKQYFKEFMNLYYNKGGESSISKETSKNDPIQ